MAKPAIINGKPLIDATGKPLLCGPEPCCGFASCTELVDALEAQGGIPSSVSVFLTGYDPGWCSITPSYCNTIAGPFSLTYTGRQGNRLDYRYFFSTPPYCNSPSFSLSWVGAVIQCISAGVVDGVNHHRFTYAAGYDEMLFAASGPSSASPIISGTYSGVINFCGAGSELNLAT